VIVKMTHIKCKCLGRNEELSWTLMMYDRMNQKVHGDSVLCPSCSIVNLCPVFPSNHLVIVFA